MLCLRTLFREREERLPEPAPVALLTPPAPTASTQQEPVVRKQASGE